MLDPTHGLIPEPNRNGAGQSPLRAPLLKPSPNRLDLRGNPASLLGCPFRIHWLSSKSYRCDSQLYPIPKKNLPHLRKGDCCFIPT